MQFSKYQGAGNDFIMILRSEWPSFDEKLTPVLCDRKKGIGADGVIVIESSENCDFEVNYLNADGSKSFCGNGARCSVLFAYNKGVISKKITRFDAIDGEHTGEILIDNTVKISMFDVDNINEVSNNEYVCNTGSPHYIFTEFDLKELNVKQEGTKIRYSDRFKEKGINVNWLSTNNQSPIRIKTYERGVEDETLACGTGATAAALVLNHQFQIDSPIDLKAEGGLLRVYFNKLSEGAYSDIFLEGPTIKVYEGRWNI